MDAQNWLWIGLIVVLLLCCLPMLRMGRRGGWRGTTRANRPSKKPGDVDRT